MSTRTPRADAGTVRATARDVEAMGWVVEMDGMPADQIERLTGATAAAVRQMFWRWRRAGWAETGQLGETRTVAKEGVYRRVAGPAWAWATRLGCEMFGAKPYEPHRPSAQRVPHTRAVNDVRLWVESDAGWSRSSPAWHGERELRWHLAQKIGSTAARRHLPDAVIEYGTDAGRGRLAVEVEVSPKAVQRTGAIMAALLSEGIDADPFADVLYVVSRDAWSVVERARADLAGTRADWPERIQMRRLEELT